MDTEERTEIALEYLARGWSVIPVGTDKRPLIKWTRFQTERATVEEVRSWFSTPDVHIGIVTGAISNLTVVDVEAEGDTSMFKGVETYTVKTGGGGWHYYFQHEPDMSNAVRTLPYVDVRSEGGYVVAAGSETTKGPYAVMEEGEVAKMPEYIKRALMPQLAAGAMDKPRYSDDVLANYPGFGEGQRNNEMARFIGAVLRRTHQSLWVSAAWPLIVQANERNTPPLNGHELRAVFNSIATREEQKETPGLQVVGLDGTVDEIAEATPEEVEEGLGHVFDVADQQPVDTDIFYATNLEVFDEALQGGFSPGDLVVLTGPTGNGKTSFAQDLTMSLVGGAHKLPTLWFSYEVMPRPLAKKFKELGLTHEQPVYMPYNTEERTVEGIAKWTRAAYHSKGVRAVVVDHLDFIYSERADKRLNQSDAIKATVTELKALATSIGVVVILMVHINKEFTGGTPDVRHITGSSGPGQLADSVFFLERLKNSKDQGLATYFSEDTRITLIKNRRSGVTPSIICQFMGGRFITNTAAQERYENYEATRQSVDEEWTAIAET